MWMAGAGIQGGRALGATDEVGLHVIEDRLHVHDLHATILHLLGVNTHSSFICIRADPSAPHSMRARLSRNSLAERGPRSQFKALGLLCQPRPALWGSRRGCRWSS
jgi:hypothetical protein